MLKKGTLLTTPDDAIEDFLNAQRPSINTGILDLMQLSTTWSSREELESSVQKWAQGKLTREGTHMSDDHTLATGKRPKRMAGEETVASETNDDASMEDATPHDLGDLPIVVNANDATTVKTPRHG